ncbi:MAG: hypothetical protein AAF804_01140 [Bacteroidota bacterium]
MHCQYGALIAILLGLFVLQACDQEPAPKPPVQERSEVRFFNALDEPPVNVRFRTYGETRFLTDRLMPYTSWPEGGYVSLLTRFNDTDTTSLVDNVFFDIVHYLEDTLLIDGYREVLPKGSLASFYLVDSLGKLIMAKTSDQFDKPTGERAAYRFINLYPFFNGITLESSVVSDSLDFKFSNGFLGHSGFINVESGRRTLKAINNSSQTVIDSLSRVDLKPGAVYVFYVLSRNGFPVLEYERVN